MSPIINANTPTIITYIGYPILATIKINVGPSAPPIIDIFEGVVDLILKSISVPIKEIINPSTIKQILKIFFNCSFFLLPRN